MKKLLLVVVVPFVLVVGSTLALYYWDHGALPGMRPTVIDVNVRELTRDHRGVRVHGTAHYEVRLKQTAGDQTWWVFPLMEPKNTGGRDIHAMVRTQTAPDGLLGYEDLTVEGLARPPGRLVPMSAREAMLVKGYSFTDDFVLIEAFDEPDAE